MFVLSSGPTERGGLLPKLAFMAARSPLWACGCGRISVAIADTARSRRRVLDELCPSWPGRAAAADAASSVDLDAALAVLAVDRAEAALIAARASADAADPGRVRGHGVGSKHRAFMVRHARQLRLDRRVRDLTARFLSTPAAGLDDIALKLAATIAAGEAGQPDASTFPWSELRQTLADMVGLVDAGS